MKFDYVKVLLYAYPKLRDIIAAVSVGVENKAMLSYKSYDGALEVAERIADEILLKKNLSDAAETLENMLRSLTREEVFFLEYKYFRRKKILREKFGGFVPSCSQRSYFRKQELLLRKVASLLLLHGWTQERFFEAFGNFSFFMRLYRALIKGKERTLCSKREERGITFKTAQG